MSRAYRFEGYLCRTPGDSVVRGLRGAGGDDPDPERFRAEHGAYIDALEAAGGTVEVLPALEDYPDAVFIEDAALCIGGTAIALRPGAPSRAGEVAELVPALKRNFGRVVTLDGPGTVDGGDVLVTENHAFVGLSSRTDQKGFEALAEIVAGLGLEARSVALPPGVLHLKSDCGLLDETTVFATPRLAASGCFAGYDVIETPQREQAAANLIRVNDVVLVTKGYPQTAALLGSRGYRVETVDVGEAAKLDGGLSCMSLRFQAP